MNTSNSFTGAVGIISGLLLLAILIGCSEGSAQENDGVFRFQLGQYEFDIPRRYIVNAPLPAWIRWIPGLDDDSRSALFVIPAKEINSAVPGYQISDGRYRDDIRGLLMVLTPDEMERYRHSRLFAQLEDLWLGVGSYKDRRVEKSAEGRFKVYRGTEYPRSWALVKEYPDSTKSMPAFPLAFWIAHCLEGGKPLGETGRGVSCQSYALMNDVVIEFDVSDYNVDVIDKIRDFLITKVSQWKRSS